MMRGKRLVALLALIMFAATACNVALDKDQSGSIALVPFFSEEWGIRGVVPQACQHTGLGNFECEGLTAERSPAVIDLLVYPGPLDELVALVLAQLSIPELPERTGSYRGTAFTWDLYAFEAQIIDAGPEDLRVDLALAEADSASYLVALVTLPESYDANAALFETVFTHAVYALAPLE